MRHVIVGTAGHIDHGKTRLVEALTGIDCDRWAEEKDRGITIDLGFAHLEEDDLQIGFVDVPGHERFLHNALAGLGGIRILMLVVAADEGVKPQTREHLDICSLLGIPGAVAVLTKTDLVEPDLLELARLELEDLLAPTPFAGAPMLSVSSVNGEGIEKLRAALIDLATRLADDPDPVNPVRLPVDRAFHLLGRGVVVTGTLVDGVARSGQTLEVAPRQLSTRIRSIQVHGAARESAEAGERTALQLSGVDLASLPRGVQLVSPGSIETSTSVMGSFQLLDAAPIPLSGWTPIRFHIYSDEVLGRLRPLTGTLSHGGKGPVEIRLARPVALMTGDRFVVRRPSPAATLGGGEVLDPRWRRRRGPRLERAVEALEGDLDEVLHLWVEETREAGADCAALARRAGLPPAEVETRLGALVEQQRLLKMTTTPPRWITPGNYRRVAQRSEAALAAYFRDHRLARGMSKAEAVARILPRRAADLADVYLGWLEAQGILVVEAGQVNLPGRQARLTGEESTLARAILEQYEAGGLAPPPPAEVDSRLGAKPQIVEGVIRYLVERGKLVRLPGGLIIAGSVLADLRSQLRETGWESFSVPEFKDRFGLTRKWAIPLLEHLDSSGATRRIGDRRQIVQRR